MFTGALSVVAVLLALVALADWLERHTWMRHLGAALMRSCADREKPLELPDDAGNLELLDTYVRAKAGRVAARDSRPLEERRRQRASQ